MHTTSSSPAVRPAATFQHVLRPMEAAAARRKRLVPAADQAWQGASPLQRRLAVATATTLRRPPHPLRRTGAAQHHLSPMRASSAKRDNAGGERARARRKAAWCRCRKAWRLRLGFSPNEAWRPCRRSRFAHLRRNALNARPADATRGDCDATVGVRRANGWTKNGLSVATKISSRARRSS